MADVANRVVGGQPGKKGEAPPIGTVIIEWAGMATGDVGIGAEYPQYGDKCVDITGTIGTSTCTIEGTNESDAAGAPIVASFKVLRDAGGTALSFTALTSLPRQILENPRFIRPQVAGGAGASGIKVTIMARRDRQQM